MGSSIKQALSGKYGVQQCLAARSDLQRSLLAWLNRILSLLRPIRDSRDSSRTVPFKHPEVIYVHTRGVQAGTESCAGAGGGGIWGSESPAGV